MLGVAHRAEFVARVPASPGSPGYTETVVKEEPDMVIERIDSPADLKALKRPEIDILAREIRELLIATCAANGGHLGPNLGVVELTLALHRVFPCRTIDDRLGRKPQVMYIRFSLAGASRYEHAQGGGISGFSMRSESGI